MANQRSVVGPFYLKSIEIFCARFAEDSARKCGRLLLDSGRYYPKADKYPMWNAGLARNRALDARHEASGQYSSVSSVTIRVQAGHIVSCS